jgi:orotate phosphoribosyltransferase-like protein
MDMKPIVLTQDELQARKARELKHRGYSAAEIADAMGLRKDRVNDLLRVAAPRKPAAEARPGA